MGAKHPNGKRNSKGGGTWTATSTMSIASDRKRDNRDHVGESSSVTLSDFKFERNFMFNIGRGGFGRVLALVHRETGNYFAIKSLVKAKLISRRQVKNAMNEFEILKSLQHNNHIVNMWYAFQDKHNLYLALDLMLGGSLSHALQREPDRKFDAYRAKFYMAELVLGLQFLHSHHIIHRDIKPDNLLIDTEGHVRITDFNASLRMPEDPDPAQRHTEGWGTRDFRAPEIYLRRGAGYMYACDWWSAGSTLYVMMTGKKPFARKEKSAEAYVRGIIAGDFDASWGRDGAALPTKEASQFCRALLEADPSARIGCAGGPAGEVELMTHPFFDQIDWDAMERRDPGLAVPWIPNLEENEERTMSSVGESRTAKKASEIQSYSAYFDSSLDHEERLRVLQRNMGILGFDGFDDYYGSSDDDEYRSLNAREQSQFKSWEYSVDAKKEVEHLPEFAVLQQVSAMEPDELKEFVLNSSKEKLELVCDEMKKLRSFELQENFEKVKAVMKADELQRVNSEMNTRLISLSREVAKLKQQLGQNPQAEVLKDATPPPSQHPNLTLQCQPEPGDQEIYNGFPEDAVDSSHFGSLVMSDDEDPQVESSSDKYGNHSSTRSSQNDGGMISDQKIH